MNHHGRDMLCDRQQRLNCAQYLPRLSDCGALVGVLLVFILFKAPLTISETRHKPNGVKHFWQDDVIHPLNDPERFPLGYIRTCTATNTVVVQLSPKKQV